MAITNIGQVSIVPMGTFNLGTTYKRLSVVTYNGSSYIAKIDNVNKPITDSTVWYLLASKGDKGDTYEVTPEDLQEIADQITSDASSAFNVHVTEKTTEFDNHVTSKTGDFDTNASNKTTTFNNNATSKTTDFNTNATSKTTDFNTNASNKTTAYDNNASAKVEYYNQNAQATIEGNEMNLDQIPKKLVEGTTINVTDSSNLPLADIQIKGNASQVTTSIAGGDEYDSPTPDHPQPISVVTGDNTVKVIGKNLLPNFINETKSGVTISSNSPTLTINGTSTGEVNGSNNWLTLPAGTYYCNAQYISGTLTNTIQIIFRKRGVTPNLINFSFSTTNYTENKSATFTLGETTDVRAYIYTGSAIKTFDQFKINIQIVRGTVADYDFEPYTEQSQLISLGNIELAKIGNYEDKIFIAKDGDETYDSLTAEQKATLTLGKWYKYGAIGKYSYNNDLSTNGLTDDQVQFLTPALNVAPNSATADLAFCNLLTSTLVNKTGLGGATGTSKIRIMVSTTYGTTYEAIRTIFSQNNLTIYYQQLTPTITEITDTTLIGQLDNLLAMKTNRNITNMFTVTDNEEPTLAVLYRQDLTTLFNNLTSAILSLGNNT